MAFYGGMIVFFAARETVKAWAEKREMKRRHEGQQEGRRQERERILRELARLDDPIAPELLRVVLGEPHQDESA